MSSAIVMINSLAPQAALGQLQGSVLNLHCPPPGTEICDQLKSCMMLTHKQLLVNCKSVGDLVRVTGHCYQNVVREWRMYRCRRSDTVELY